MKKIIPFIFLVLLISISCSEKLDIEPTGQVNIDKFLENEEGLNYLKNGAYSLARNVYGRYFIHFSEMLADTGEINFSGSFDEFYFLQQKNLYSTFSFAEYAWRDAYSAINNCNLIIDNIDVVDEDHKAELEAQAKFIRGLLYFDLVRFYAFPYGTDAMNNTGVILSLKGVKSTDDIKNLPLESVRNIFNVVQSDLTFAYQNLYEDEMFYASKYSAAAILSRYYLTVKNYDSASFYAGEVINSGYFELTPDYIDAFNHIENNMEDVFTWQQTVSDNVGKENDGLATFYASTNETGRADMEISEDFIYSTYDSTDKRGIVQYGASSVYMIDNIFYEGFNPYKPDSVIFCAKWLDYSTNITMVRLSEMYLNRAEANQMLIENGTNMMPVPMPVEDIKMIRGRAGNDTSGVDTITLDEIIKEKYKELIFEGQRLHDYKRWGTTVWVWDTDTTKYYIDFDSEELIIPIPKSEIDANSGI